MPRRRARNAARSRIVRTPQLYILEEAAVVLADTVVSNTIYTSAVGTAALEMAQRFTLNKMTMNVNYGSVASAKVFVVVRRVPSGYSAPAITISTGNLSIIDFPDVLAYGFLDGQDTVPYRLEMSRPSVIVHPGDSVIIQCVSNVASTGQTVSAFGRYTLSTM